MCCYPEDAEALTTSPWLRHITFIGSEEVGRKVRHCHYVYNLAKLISNIQVVAAAATQLTPVTVELGGKDTAIVMPSTDIKQYESVWMRGLLCECFYVIRMVQN